MVAPKGRPLGLDRRAEALRLKDDFRGKLFSLYNNYTPVKEKSQGLIFKGLNGNQSSVHDVDYLLDRTSHHFACLQMNSAGGQRPHRLTTEALHLGRG